MYNTTPKYIRQKLSKVSYSYFIFFRKDLKKLSLFSRLQNPNDNRFKGIGKKLFIRTDLNLMTDKKHTRIGIKDIELIHCNSLKKGKFVLKDPSKKTRVKK